MFFYLEISSVYKINRKLHDRLELQILSSRTGGISHSFATITPLLEHSISYSLLAESELTLLIH